MSFTALRELLIEAERANETALREAGIGLIDVRVIQKAHAALAAPSASTPGSAAPIDMVLHCPACGLQHIDEADGHCAHDACPRAECCAAGDCQEPWTNPPHRSHLCRSCGHIWRPADVPTNGVQAVKTVGKDDSPITVTLKETPNGR